MTSDGCKRSAKRKRYRESGSEKAQQGSDERRAGKGKKPASRQPHTKRTPQKIKGSRCDQHREPDKPSLLITGQKVSHPMISNFESNVYSEELFTVTEQEHDEVMALMAADDFAGYEDFSRELESENFVVVNGSLQHKPEPASKRLQGFEL